MNLLLDLSRLVYAKRLTMGIFWNIPGLCINVCDLVSNCIVKALSNHNLGNSLLHAPSTD